MSTVRFCLSALALLLTGCVSTPQKPPPSTAPAPQAEEKPRGSGFAGRRLSLQILDERTDLADSVVLVRKARAFATQRLKAAGATLDSDAPDALVLVLSEYQSAYDSNAVVGCAAFAGRMGQAAFLPGETRARRCASDESVGANSPLLAGWIQETTADVPSAKDKPGLARAFVGALNELLDTLERRAR